MADEEKEPGSAQVGSEPGTGGAGEDGASSSADKPESGQSNPRWHQLSCFLVTTKTTYSSRAL